MLTFQMSSLCLLSCLFFSSVISFPSLIPSKDHGQASGGGGEA